MDAYTAKNHAHIQRLHPNMRPLAAFFLHSCLAHGYTLRITQSFRTDDEQRALYAQGRTAPGKIVTKAKDASESPHGRGCAFDVAFVVDGRLSWDEALPWVHLGAIAEACGLEWGGSFNDKPHFQMPGWRTYTYPPSYR